ncbi:hypothetical protein QQS21_008568 [Conoideocrella luteorostrata]|uniref:MYND-type domain-containing protein n=1 Tax=Conoideocrella luteorostrata TaxID=1105319 RepID=A0AAJ0CIN3_9HYPO|nr:hypothetical protein QQS21_008568 [Conoideocrella luteorostrata]
MLTPAVANRFSWLYATGNTPATSLTRSVPIGKDVDVLSLGCGDVRNVLYTCYVERGLISRKIDVTCCDYDEKVIGRNIVLLTLLLESKGKIKSSDLWDIYYHLYVADGTVEIVLRHVQKLMHLLESLQAWKDGSYGTVIKFCDEHSLNDVRGVCRRILDGAELRNTSTYAKRFKENLQTKNQVSERLHGKNASTFTGMRSAGPVSLKSPKDMIKAFQTYGEHGTVTPDVGKSLVPNPMFASLVSPNEVLHYGSDPILGYHLATAFAPLSENSPLRIADDIKDYRTAAAAKTQFFEWVAAFRDIARERIVLRFAVADVFACCHTLQHASASGKLSANWYRRQWDLKVLVLDADEYRSKKTGPVAFDAIDTSNLADHVGALNLVIATSSLLKPEPWATLYIEVLIKRGKSQQEAFEKFLCGKPATVSLLLGVAPVQYWTNAKCESHVDEVFIGMLNDTSSEKANETQLHSRLAWKRDDQFSGQRGGRGKLHVDERTLSTILFQIYLQMFSSENYKMSAAVLERSAYFTHFHRGNFASFLKVVKHRVKTNWPGVCSQLVDRISQDRTLALSTNQMQELGAQMYLQGVSTESWLFEDSATSSKAGPFRNWKNIPLVVAVTIVVPRPALDRLYKGSKKHEISSPTLVGSLRASPRSSNQWHNVYSDVQIVFGTIKNCPDNENMPVIIEQDERGWSGDSPLIASFVVPTAALQIDPVDTVVGLCVPPSAQAALLYMRILGMEMNVFETKLSDSSNVFLKSLMPGQTGYPVVCGGVQQFKDTLDGADKAYSNKLLIELPASESQITAVIGHADILSEQGKKLLQDKVSIELQQKDPFTIDVVFGNRILTCPIKFPVPVSQAGSKSRVARKSGYVEIIAPVASSRDSEVLADFLYPARLDGAGLPAALNASHLNLDALPILNVEDKGEMQWLVTLASLEFSSREKASREEGQTSDGIAENTRVNFKESLFTMFMLASGLQGGQTGMFAINHPGKGGIHMLMFVSAIRLDADNSSVVLDAAVIPLTNELVASGRMESFLLLIRTLECCTINVNDSELVLWKRVLPSIAERCRTYSHRPDCEYNRRGATVPLSVDPGQKVLCSCGNGKLPKDFISLPEWDIAAPNAVRIAISPTFAVPFVEDVVDPADVTKGKGQLEPTDRCRSCGLGKAKDGSILKKCMRCKIARYCSAECQKKDWKKHRMECMDVE